MKKHSFLIFLSPLLIILAGVGVYFYSIQKSLPTPKPAGKPKAVNISGKTKVKYPQDYTIVMIGDSMTETLGNSDEIRNYLSQYYKGKTFEVLNYGFGATNILTVMNRITKETEHGRKFRPIEQIDYDLVLLESFGQNPLSEYGLEEGLKVQTQELIKIVNKLKETNPRGKIVFVATISPNRVIFAQNQLDLTPEKRSQWVDERNAYIKNHIDFAKANGIPVINIFQKSLMENGDGNPEFINTADYIHPSPTGIVFISKHIADFIYKENILTQ